MSSIFNTTAPNASIERLMAAGAAARTHENRAASAGDRVSVNGCYRDPGRESEPA